MPAVPANNTWVRSKGAVAGGLLSNEVSIKCAHTLINVSAAQEFVRNEGGMKAVAALVAAGERAVADAAVHTLWLLVRDAKASLRPGGLLGMPGVQLVDALIDIVSAGQKVTRLGRIGPTVVGQCRHAADLACKVLLWLLRRNVPPTGCHCVSLVDSFLLLPAL